MTISRANQSFVLLTLTSALIILSAPARADDSPPSSRWFAWSTAGYGYAFASAGGADDSTSSNGTAFVYSAALGVRLKPWLALHGGAWGAWLPNAVVKYDEWERETGVLRMQAFGPGVTLMAPWGGYVSGATGVAWATGTYQERYHPLGVAITSELGYRARVAGSLRLGVGLTAGGFVGSLWTAAQGGIALSAAL